MNQRTSSPVAPVPAVWGETAPSDFTFDLQVASAPMVKRGQTVSLTFAGPTDDDVKRVELWQDGNLVYQLDDTDTVKGGQTGQVRFAMDVVNMNAGGHLFIARAYDADGKMAQSQPLSLPTMDLPEDLGTFRCQRRERHGSLSRFLARVRAGRHAYERREAAWRGSQGAGRRRRHQRRCEAAA